MLRCAIVPPVPVPYREPLFERLAARAELTIGVIYQARAQGSWDQAPGWFPGEHRYEAMHLRSLHIPRAGRSPVTWPRGLERALSAFAADVVVVSEFGPATMRALAWCRRHRRALVILTEVSGAVESTLTAAQQRLHRALAHRADGLIAVSTAARERLLRLGVAGDHVSVSLQSVDEDALAAVARSRRPVEQEPVEILAVARLVPDKELDSLIESFSAAGLEHGQASLSIVGGGPLEAHLRRRAGELSVPASFHGAVPAAQLPSHYARASIFTLPSRYEPFGVAVREAAIAGLPLLCSTAVGAAQDLARDGGNALMFAPGDVPAMTQALQRLVNEPELRARMGAVSREIALAHPLSLDVEAFAARLSAAARAARARR